MWRAAKGSGQCGRRTLEEGGAGGVLIGKDDGSDRRVLWGQRVEEAKEEDWDEEEDCRGVMIGCVGKQEEYERNDSSEKRECFPTADFAVADHRCVECIVRSAQKRHRLRSGYYLGMRVKL